MKNIVITGGAGFIGSHVVRLFVNKYPEYKIINLDKLTYAGNLANLKDIEDKPNYKFVRMDICDFDAFYQLMQDEQIDGIITWLQKAMWTVQSRTLSPSQRPTSWALSASFKQQSFIGNHSQRSTRASASTTSVLMRFMEHSR